MRTTTRVQRLQSDLGKKTFDCRSAQRVRRRHSIANNAERGEKVKKAVIQRKQFVRFLHISPLLEHSCQTAAAQSLQYKECARTNALLISSHRKLHKTQLCEQWRRRAAKRRCSRPQRLSAVGHEPDARQHEPRQRGTPRPRGEIRKPIGQKGRR